MEKQDTKTNQNTFKLPDRLVTSVDLMRTIRELKILDDWLNQASIRSGGQQVQAPKTSATLEEIAIKNRVSLLEKDQRQQLIAVLDSFSVNAPKIHMSFAVEPSGGFLNQMIIWLRANVNPIILLDVGLQPALAAGCSVRTTNKLFDMSLRNRFVDSRHFLVDAIDQFDSDPTVSDIEATVQATTEPTQNSVAPENPAPTPPTTSTPAAPVVQTDQPAPAPSPVVETPAQTQVQPTSEVKTS